MDSYHYIGNIYQQSTIYQYAFFTKNKNVLNKTVLEKDNTIWLKLDLEDIITKEVTYEKIGPFTQKERTDIQKRVFDLENKVFYIPYVAKKE